MLKNQEITVRANGEPRFGARLLDWLEGLRPTPPPDGPLRRVVMEIAAAIDEDAAELNMVAGLAQDALARVLREKDGLVRERIEELGPRRTP